MGSWDTWCTRRVPRGVCRCGLSGHVVHSHGIRRVALGVGFRDTWHTRKTSGGWHSVWASGTRGTLRRKIRRGLSVWLSGHVARSEGKSEGVSRCGFWDTWHAPKEIRRGLSVWLSGHEAYPECSRGDWPLDGRPTTGMDLLVRTDRSIGRRWPSDLGSTAGT